MVNVALPVYLIQVVPQFMLIFYYLSHLIYQKIKWTYLLFLVIAATLCSTLFSTSGEIVFGLVYGLILLAFQSRGILIVYTLFWEGYLIVSSLLGSITSIALYLVPNHLDSVNFISAIMVNIGIVLLIRYATRSYQSTVSYFNQLIRSDSVLSKAMVFYTAGVCVCLYLVEYVFERLNIAISAEWLLSAIFIFLIILNIGSMYFLNHTIKINAENQMLHATEKAKLSYYTDIELQQSHTRKILHDYKNVLSTLQLSLNDAASPSATEQTRQLIIDAQATLNKIQPNNSALSTILTLPLRSLIYLKWTQASSQKIWLNIQCSGTITITNNHDLMDTLRAAGILLDNAIEASDEDNEIDLLLAQSSNELSLTVINGVSPDFKLSRLNQPRFTTRGESHGLGLTNLREITQANEHINTMKQVIENRLSFTLVIEV